MPVSALTDSLPILDMPWPDIRARVNEFWVAREAPHISIMAQTRAGKSYLVTRGLLPLCQNDRVLIIDSKGNDPTLAGFGKPVREIPNKVRTSWKSAWAKPEPRNHWFRLVMYKGPQNAAHARDQVRRAFDRIFSEGDWVVFIDELRTITDPQYPGLHLKPYYEEMILRGGSNGIASGSLSQEPRWCPGCFYTQSNFYFFSRIEDDASQKRLAEVGSSKQLGPELKRIPRHNWLYMDNMDDTGDRFWARTKVTLGRG